MEVKTGSRVLMVCVKDTATAAKETLVRQCPNACRNAGSVTAFRNSLSGFSYFTRRVVLVVGDGVFYSQPNYLKR